MEAQVALKATLWSFTLLGLVSVIFLSQQPIEFLTSSGQASFIAYQAL